MKVVDMHCDTIYEINQMQHDGKDVGLRKNNLNISLEKMQKGNYILQNFAMFTHLQKDHDPIKHVQDMIDTYYLELEKNQDMIAPVYSYKDIEENMKNHKMSALLTLEEGAVVNNDLSYLRNYYRLGVRMITLTWNFYNGIGYSHTLANRVCDEGKGLTEFGIDYIKECERLGIIIDVSHLSDAGFYDVLTHTTKPFVASHSNARTVSSHSRNMSDDMIKALSKRGGVMGINFAGAFLDPHHADYSSIEDMVKHICHIKEVGGIDCIGLGTDFDGIVQDLQIKDASQISLLYEALKKANLSEEEIEKIFYKNVLRVYKEVLK